MPSCFRYRRQGCSLDLEEREDNVSVWKDNETYDVDGPPIDDFTRVHEPS